MPLWQELAWVGYGEKTTKRNRDNFKIRWTLSTKDVKINKNEISNQSLISRPKRSAFASSIGAFCRDADLTQLQLKLINYAKYDRRRDFNYRNKTETKREAPVTTVWWRAGANAFAGPGSRQKRTKMTTSFVHRCTDGWRTQGDHSLSPHWGENFVQNLDICIRGGGTAEGVIFKPFPDVQKSSICSWANLTLVLVNTFFLQ